MWQWNPFAPFVALTTLTTLWTAWWVWRRPPVTGSREFVAVALCVGVHGLGTTWDLSAATLELKNVGLFFIYVGFLFTPTCALRFALAFTGRARLTGQRWWLLNVPALVVLALFLTNRFHHLAELSTELSPRDGFVMRHAVGGPAFWAYAAFAYLLVALCSVLYVLEMVHGGVLRRRQAVLLFAGTLAPWAGNVIYLAGLAPDPSLDLTPFAYGLTSLLWAVALTRGHMLELVPVARNRVFEMLSDAVLVVDGKGRVLDANAAMATLLSRPLSTLPGLTVAQLGLPTDGELVRDGKTFSIGRSEVTGNGATGEVLLFRDVSAQRRAIDEAAALAQARADFLARMSHEVRTPLFGLLGATELAMDGAMDARARELLEVARRSGAALAGVVDEILEFERLGSEHARAERLDVDLPGLCDDLLTLFAGRAQERGLTLRVELDAPLPYVRTDGPRLRQVLSNLLSNALKFTARGEVVLGVTTRELGAQVAVTLAVRDTGPGIAPEAKARVFEPFAQADETISRRYGGTGLGLSIVRELVQLLGGGLSLDSELGRGSTFTVQLTCEPGHAPTRAPEAPRGRYRGTVLVVDDHPVGGAITRAMLEREGCTVELAPTGEAALERARADDFAVIFLDVRLPDLSGTTVLERLREAAVTTPVVWLTADVHAPGAAAQGLLHKPFSRQQLCAVLERTLPPRADDEDRAPPEREQSRASADPPGAPDAPRRRSSHVPVVATASAAPSTDARDASIRAAGHFPVVTAAFAESSAAELTALEAAARAGDRSTVARLVHDLRGSAGLVGATEVAASCATVLAGAEVLPLLPALHQARARDLERLRRSHA